MLEISYVFKKKWQFKRKTLHKSILHGGALLTPQQALEKPLKKEVSVLSDKMLGVSEEWQIIRKQTQLMCKPCYMTEVGK